jgi:predicted transcriptional regulator
MQTQIKPIAIKLPEQDRERLKKIGEAKKRSVHWLAKEAITQFIEREEAAERFRQETLAAWEEYRQTGKSVPNDDVMAWLDSWETDDEQKAPL